MGNIGHDSLFAARLLAPSPGGCLQKPCADKPFVWAKAPPDGFITGNVFIDGPAMGSAPFLRAGWGLVMLSAQLTVVATAFGAIPEHPVFQTVAFAELYALVSALEVALPPVTFFSDCLYVVEGVQQGRACGRAPPGQCARGVASAASARPSRTKGWPLSTPPQRGASGRLRG